MAFDVTLKTEYFYSRHECEVTRVGFKGKDQLPLVMVYKEYVALDGPNAGTTDWADVLFSTSTYNLNSLIWRFRRWRLETASKRNYKRNTPKNLSQGNH